MVPDPENPVIYFFAVFEEKKEKGDGFIVPNSRREKRGISQVLR